MATEFDDALKKLEDMLAKAAASGDAEGVKTFTKAVDVMKASLTAASERVKKYAIEIDSTTKTARSEREARSGLTADIKKQSKSIIENTRTSKEAKEELEKYTASLTVGLSSTALKESIKAQIENNYKSAKVQSVVQEAYNKTASMAAKPMAAAGTIFSAYQAGGSQIGTASAALQAGMELGGSAAESLGKIASSAAPALMALGPYGMAAGLALSAAGAAAQIFGKGLSESATKILPKFSTEIEKNINAFQSLSSTGAVFAGGLGEMIKVSGNAGYTLDSFNKILTTNKEAFANSGLGMTEASKRFSDVSSKMITGGFRKDLLNLGFTLEEQGGLVADVFSNLQRTGRMASTSDEQVSKMTREYGENLRTISAITGQDAKAKMAAAKKDMDALDIQAKMLKLQKDQPQAYEKMQGMLAVMPEEMKGAFLQSFSGEAITDPAMNVLMENVPELRDAFSEMVKVVNDPNTSPAQAIEAQTKAMNLAREGFINNADKIGEIGKAARLGAKGVASDTAKLGGSLIGGLAKFGPQTEKQGKAAADAANTTDEQTQAMSALIIANNDMNVSIQKIIMSSDALTTYMNMAKTATNLFKDALEEIINQFGGDRTKRKLEEQRKAAEAEAARVSTRQLASTPQAVVARQFEGTAADKAAGGGAPLAAAKLSPTELLKKNNLSAADVKQVKGNLITLKDGRVLDTTKQDFVGGAVPATPAAPEAPAAPTAPTAPVAPVTPVAPAAAPPTLPATPAVPATPSAPARPVTLPKSFPGPGTIDPKTNQWVPIQLATPNIKGTEIPKNVDEMIKFKQKDLEDKGVDISQDSKFQKAVNDIKNESVGDGQKMLEVIQLVARALEEANQFHRETAANTKKTVEVMQ